VAEYYARPELESGALVELFSEYRAHAYDISIVFRQRKSIAPRLRVFVDFLVAQFSPPPWRIRSN
jgi:DNA-binding transcriptional LysR family regulator